MLVFRFSEISRSDRISLDTRSLGSNYIPILFSLRKKNETVFRHSYTVKIKDRREVLIIPHWEYSAKQALFCFPRSLLCNIKPKGVHVFPNKSAFYFLRGFNALLVKRFHVCTIRWDLSYLTSTYIIYYKHSKVYNKFKLKMKYLLPQQPNSGGWRFGRRLFLLPIFFPADLSPVWYCNFANFLMFRLPSLVDMWTFRRHSYSITISSRRRKASCLLLQPQPQHSNTMLLYCFCCLPPDWTCQF